MPIQGIPSTTIQFKVASYRRQVANYAEYASQEVSIALWDSTSHRAILYFYRDDVPIPAPWYDKNTKIMYLRFHISGLDAILSMLQSRSQIYCFFKYGLDVAHPSCGGLTDTTNFPVGP